MWPQGIDHGVDYRCWCADSAAFTETFGPSAAPGTAEHSEKQRAVARGLQEVTEEALEAIADQALSRGTGARGLRAIIEEVLLDVMYELPGDDEAGRVVVDLDSVRGETSPTVVPRSADHPDRAAS